MDITTHNNPGQTDDGVIGVLTERGKLVIYHFTVIDNVSQYFKYLSFLRKTEERAARNQASSDKPY